MAFPAAGQALVSDLQKAGLQPPRAACVDKSVRVGRGEGPRQAPHVRGDIRFVPLSEKAALPT